MLGNLGINDKRMAGVDEILRKACIAWRRNNVSLGLEERSSLRAAEDSYLSGWILFV